MQPFTLETERLFLRKPDARDVPNVVEFYGTSRAEYVGGPQEPRQAWRTMAMFCGHWTIRGYGLFTVEVKETRRAIGLIGPWFPEGWPETEIGWHIWSPEDEGQGYALEAAREVHRFVRAVLGWQEVVSYIDAPNVKSIALAEKMGAVLDESADAPSFSDKTTLVYRHSADGLAA